MENTFFSKLLSKGTKDRNKGSKAKNLARAAVDTTYTIVEIKTNDEEIESFLFTLGCYAGQKVTVISKLADNYVISVKDARYSIDTDLAKAIII